MKAALIPLIIMAAGVFPACQHHDRSEFMQNETQEPPTETNETPSPPDAPFQEMRGDRERPVTARTRLARNLWKTALGKSYFLYLFGEFDREVLPERAREIVGKILGDTDQIVSKVAAVQLMDEDLYVRGRVSEDVLTRISVLEYEMTKGRQEVESSAIKKIFEKIPFVFLAAIPIGSPLVRGEFKKLVRGNTARVLAWARNKESIAPPAIQWQRMIRPRDFFEDYEFGKPLDAFTKTAIPYALIELIRTEQKLEGSSADLEPWEIEDSANH